MNALPNEIAISIPDALRDGLRDGNKRVIDAITNALTEAQFFALREVVEKTPVTHGTLRASMTALDPRPVGDDVVGAIGSPLAYAAPVETGTRPHFPPVQPLADWAAAKFGLPPEEATRVGFAIARKIAVEGTEGAAMFETTFNAIGPLVQEIFDRHVHEYVRDLER